ncbi:MAG: hypothetical protein KatS3mg054_0119 [Chloroflexus sp.]|nr:MAG: hypothetical protein KatS3mg054_0119 [Chloroflexus sp.]
MERILTLLVFLLLVSAAIAQPARLPDIGRLMSMSRDAAYMNREGCAVGFSKENSIFSCLPRLTVTLSRGRTTVVQNRLVNDGSAVMCGCGFGCNDYGMVLGYLRVAVVRNGYFQLSHAYALGNEMVSCIVY